MNSICILLSAELNNNMHYIKQNEIAKSENVARKTKHDNFQKATMNNLIFTWSSLSMHSAIHLRLLSCYLATDTFLYQQSKTFLVLMTTDDETPLHGA